MLSRSQIDLFRSKLELYKLADYVPEYSGPNSYEATTLWLSQHFSSLYENKRRALILHLTCATGACGSPRSSLSSLSLPSLFPSSPTRSSSLS